MAEQGGASFGKALYRAIQEARSSQADLARQLKTNPGQVSRWVNNRCVPHAPTVRKIEQILGVNLTESFTASTPEYELYISAPITGLEKEYIATHHDAVAQVVDAASQYVNGVYWPGKGIRAIADLRAADIATEQRMTALAKCSSYLYLQFNEIVRPTSALVEFGFALGKRLKTTLIIKRDLHNPYMLEGFGAVAARLPFLPDARIYPVSSAEDAAALITRNGRELFGLM
jgi:transcriptional regulator with XRE-family HTH domain